MGGFNMGRSETEMPQEMIDIIESVFGESTELRRGLLGQALGLLTGQGPMEWIPGGIERAVGHYERQLVNTGAADEQGPIMEWKDVWVGPPPIEPGEGEWRPMEGGGGIQGLRATHAHHVAHHRPLHDNHQRN